MVRLARGKFFLGKLMYLLNCSPFFSEKSKQAELTAFSHRKLPLLRPRPLAALKFRINRIDSGFPSQLTSTSALMKTASLFCILNLEEETGEESSLASYRFSRGNRQPTPAINLALELRIVCAFTHLFHFQILMRHCI